MAKGRDAAGVGWAFRIVRGGRLFYLQSAVRLRIVDLKLEAPADERGWVAIRYLTVLFRRRLVGEIP